MRCFFAGILLASTAAFGQSIVELNRFPVHVRNLLEQREAGQSLQCAVAPIKPALNFGFRFQAGYTARVPMDQYLGPGHVWAVVTKITPEAGDRRAVYLVTRVNLPNIPETKVEAQIGGGYLLGEGRYRVEWTLLDGMDRACRKDWNIEVALSRGERKVKVAMPANTIAELSLRGARQAARREADDVRPLRITVLLHAAPLSPRRTKLRPGDTLMLLGSLSSLLERLASRSVRLVAFNLDQQSEIFRQDDFATGELSRLAQSMNQQELGLVDYRVLQNRRGHLDFLADLLNRELTAEEPADVVIFIGPPSRYSERLPEAALEMVRGEAPHFFYFQFRPYFRRGANFPDSIQHAVGRLKGKTAAIYSPGEFAKAIEQLEHRVAGER